MTEFADETDISSKLAQEVQEELPTIYVSVKNLIAMTMGKSYEAPLEPRIQPQNVMTCAKYLLQAIKSYPLPDVEQFCAENPQPDDQLGVDRLEDICKYKVIYNLRYKAEEKGGRITRLFGKSYIRWTKLWNVFRRNTEELLKENTHIPMEEIEYFLQTYEASLTETASRERSATACTEELIWAPDFNYMLSSMQRERQQRVQERSRASTLELQSLENQLFASPSSPTQQQRSLSASKQNSSSGGEISNMEMLSIRSRATTMEQLGLEAPCLDAHAPFLQQQQNQHRNSLSPPDRSRSTTLDLFAFEQQQMCFANGNGGMMWPAPASTSPPK